MPVRSRFVPFVALVASAAFVAATGLMAARPASAVEPYDSQLGVVFVVPGPEFTEITDRADPAHSGPLDDARMDALDIQLPASSRAVILGAAVRGDASPTNRVLQVAYELTDAARARATLDSLPAVGSPFEVQGIPGAVGRSVDTPAVAYVAFVLGHRSFFLVVGGADPGHALLQDTALQVVNAAAERLAGGLAADLDGGALDEPLASEPAADEGLRASVQRALGTNDVRLALAAVAALLLYVVARRNRPVRRPVPAVPLVRANNQAWRQQEWGTAPPVLAPSDVTLGGPVAGLDAAEVDMGWSGGDIGWGDDDGHPAPTPTAAPLPAPAAVAVPFAPPPAPAGLPAPWAAWPTPVSASAAPPSPAGPAQPSSDDGHERYSFPGADRWPDDPTVAT